MLIYHILEIILLVSFFIRIFYFLSFGQKFNRNNNDIFYFYAIWLINDLIAFFHFGNPIAFFFVHCSFPIAILISDVFKKNSILQTIVICISVYFNILFRNKYIIISTYILTFIFLLSKILFSLKKPKSERIKVDVYVCVLISLVFTHLIFLFGFGNFDWSKSVYVDYFLFTMRFIYLLTLTMGHVYLRRFIIN